MGGSIHGILGVGMAEFMASTHFLKPGGQIYMKY
jgi:hypothetical protein